MRRFVYAMVACLVLAIALPVSSATVGSWKGGKSGSNAAACPDLRRACAWTGASGNSPMLNKEECVATMWVTGTLSVKPYICRDTVLANCEQLYGWDNLTATYELMTLDATNWGAENIKARAVTVEYVSGTGDVIIECEPN